MKSIILTFLLIACVSAQNGYDKFNTWNNYLTSESIASYSQQVTSVTLDSAATDNDSLNAVIVFGTSNFDSCFIDTCRTGGSYVNLASIAIGDTGSYNDFNYGTVFDNSSVTYYIRVALQDSTGTKASYKVASKLLNLTPLATLESQFNYILNHLLY